MLTRCPCNPTRITALLGRPCLRMFAQGRERRLDGAEIRSRRAHVLAKVTPERTRTRLAQVQAQHMAHDVMQHLATT